jgi:hypothetical protein
MAKRTAATIREVVMHTGWVALVAFAGVSACSGPPATATAYLMTTATCSGGGGMTVTQIGEAATSGDLPETSPSGTLISGHPITVDCSVSGGPGQFSLTLYADDSAYGTTTLSGNATYSSGDSAGGTGITGTFVTAETGTVYSGSNCTLTYGAPTLPSGATGISAGFVWATVDCPNAMANGQEQTGADGGMESATCDVKADFLFENCSQ